jgi:hypothetical protein
MIKILKSFTTLSIIIFLIILLVIYAYLPKSVGIIFSDSGEITWNVTRDSFFYSFLFTFFFLQLIFYLFTQFKLNNVSHTSVNERLTIWFRGAILLINLFFIFTVLFLGLANNAVDYSYSSIKGIGYAGSVLIFIWILAFPVFYYSKGKMNRN